MDEFEDVREQGDTHSAARRHVSVTGFFRPIWYSTRSLNESPLQILIKRKNGIGSGLLLCANWPEKAENDFFIFAAISICHARPYVEYEALCAVEIPPLLCLRSHRPSSKNGSLSSSMSELCEIKDTKKKRVEYKILG